MLMENKEFLEILLKGVFGSLLLNAEKWPLGQENFSIGRTYFYDRMRFAVPIHKVTADKICLLFDFALTEQKGVRQDCVQVSRKLCETMEGVIKGAGLWQLKFSYADEAKVREQKKKGLLDVLAFLCNAFTDRKTVNLRQLSKDYLRRFGTATAHGGCVKEDAPQEALEERIGHGEMPWKPDAISFGVRETFVPKRIPSLADGSFQGRRTELAKMHRMLSEGGRCLLSGMPGIGKSELARRYAAVFGGSYHGVLFLGFDTSLEQTLADDFRLQIRGMERSDYSQENDAVYAGRKLRRLLEEANEEYLIILDGFDAETDALLEDFLRGRYAILVTSRISGILGSRMPELCLHELEDKEALDIFADAFLRAEKLLEEGDGRNAEQTENAGLTDKRKRIREDSDVQELVLKVLDKHTASIILSASFLSEERVDGRRIAPKELAGLLAMKMEKPGMPESGEQRQFGWLKDPREGELVGLYLAIRKKFLRRLSVMLRLSELSEDETFFLEQLAEVSPYGSSIGDVCKRSHFAERKGYSETIERLIRRNWLIYERERDFACLHKIVCMVILENADERD